MKALRFAFVSALVLAAMLATAAAADYYPLTVGFWGQSEINEDGNLRFRVTASAGNINWGDCCQAADYVQLWAHITGGPAANPIDTWVLVKSKAAYDTSFTPPRPAANIGGTSPRFKLPRGTYSYSLYVVLNDGMSVKNEDGSWSATVLAVSDFPFGHPAGVVTLP